MKKKAPSYLQKGAFPKEVSETSAYFLIVAAGSFHTRNDDNIIGKRYLVLQKAEIFLNQSSDTVADNSFADFFTGGQPQTVHPQIILSVIKYQTISGNAFSSSIDTAEIPVFL